MCCIYRAIGLLFSMIQHTCTCNIRIHSLETLMFNYGRMHKNIPPRLVCGSRGACLDCMLPGVQVTAGLGFFLHGSH